MEHSHDDNELNRKNDSPAVDILLIHHTSLDNISRSSKHCRREARTCTVIQIITRYVNTLIFIAQQRRHHFWYEKTKITSIRWKKILTYSPSSTRFMHATDDHNNSNNNNKQESPANANGTRNSSACMKAHCEQM